MCTWPSATGQSSRCGAKIGCVCAAACVVACVAAEETGAGCRRWLCGVERVMAKARSERRAGVRATFWINDSVANTVFYWDYDASPSMPR